MNCAWCGTNTDNSDSHGICDDCMQTYFGVNPQEIHEEIAAMAPVERGMVGQVAEVIAL